MSTAVIEQEIGLDKSTYNTSLVRDRNQKTYINDMTRSVELDSPPKNFVSELYMTTLLQGFPSSSYITSPEKSEKTRELPDNEGILYTLGIRSHIEDLFVHDVRNIATVIKGYSSIVKRSADSENKQLLDDICNEIDYLTENESNLSKQPDITLSIAKSILDKVEFLEADYRITGDNEEIRMLNDIRNNAYRFYSLFSKEVLPGRDILERLSKAIINPEKRLVFYGDELAAEYEEGILSIIATQLLTNFDRYGGAFGRLSLTDGDGRWHLRLENESPITLEDPYSVYDEKVSIRQGGGLGLHVVKSLALQKGGEVVAYNTPNGALLEVMIPKSDPSYRGFSRKHDIEEAA